MPITISNRNVGSGNGSLMVPLVANNPAFKVAILPVDGRLEQVPSAKDGSNEINAIRVGNEIQGEVVNGGKKVSGKVLQINRQNNEIVSYKIIDKDGEEVMVDPTTAVKSDTHGEEVATIGGIDANPPGVSNENYAVKSFDNWLSESSK